MSSAPLASPLTPADSRVPGASVGPEATQRAWQREVIEGVTRSVALAAVPSCAVAFAARWVRGERDVALIVLATGVLFGLTLSRRVPPRARAAILVGLFIWTNTFLMLYGHDIPFHGVLIPMGGVLAVLVGGVRWAVWTLAAMGGTWLFPLALAAAGATPPFEIPWPSQYLRLVLLYIFLSASVVASTRVVIRSLETSLRSGDNLLQRVRREAQATQALAGRLTEAEEQERSRLSRELHDDLGQRLTALRMKLQLAQLRPELATSTIAECAPISEELLCDVRAFARGLRPPLLDEVGLGPALRALLELHTSEEMITVAFDVPAEVPRLPHATELAAYRVMQEALANAQRHAGATRLGLEIRVTGEALTIALTDNGSGFDPDAVATASPTGRHLGLVSMRERAEFIGASLDVQSARERGTTVRLRIPRTAPATVDRRPEVAIPV